MDAQNNIAFSPQVMTRVNEIIARYPEGKQKSAVIPLLHIAQKEFGWLSTSVMDYVANILRITPIEVYEVATFYSMYNLKPVGKYLLEVCHTGPCALRGAERLVDTLKKKLDIEVGETTTDGMFTLKTVECLGACGYAPMMQIGEHYYEFLDTPEKIDDLLHKCRKGEIPADQFLLHDLK